MPLGAPLMDTRVEVRDEQGRVVTEGEGQVFIGETDLINAHTCKSYFREQNPHTNSSGPWCRWRGEGVSPG